MYLIFKIQLFVKSVLYEENRLDILKSLPHPCLPRIWFLIVHHQGIVGLCIIRFWENLAES